MKDRVSILGYEVSRVSNMDEAILTMEEFIASGKFHHVVLGNMYTFITSREDQELRELSNASDLTIADGMSLVWASRLLGEPVGQKIAGWNLFEYFCKVAALKGYTIFLLGGGPGGSERVANALQKKHPPLRIVGTYSPALGPISAEENEKITGFINNASPDILWIGLGSPRQEKWIWQNRSKLNTRVAIGVGSAFDFQMGKQKQAPRWMQEWGLEWLHRPTQDPSVIWRKRYDLYLFRGVIPIIWEAIHKRFTA